ncbi:MAG: UDP-3-O-(3-hydroxymyristoyl)glucosamine N-acyltransferase [Succinivibrio sp.]|nr:UDP-3-O-(3-hydroxymyristoyl)glucosamine N-acyltransferase [Succinivibrio sp.]
MQLQEIASAIGAQLVGDGSLEIERVANLKTAGPHEISFLSDPHYHEVLSQTQAGCVILRETDLPHRQGSALITKDPYVGFAKVAQLLDATPAIASGVAQSASIAPDAKLGAHVAIGPHVCIAEGAEIGDEVQLGANVVIGPHAKIGAGTKIYPNVSVYHDCTIGEQCLLQSGAVIGSDGFGYANEQGVWLKIPQQGRVIIGNKVEIGAGTCVDRGAIDDTVIEDNVIIDNLCQIAHNVRIGFGTAIAGSTTIAGSVTIGKYCIIGGTTVLNGHISICDGVTISGATQVMRTITEPGVYSSGIPAQPNKGWRNMIAKMFHLSEMYHKLNELDRKVAKLAERQAD